MELLELEYFIRVSELNSIHKVATENNITSSAISIHISNLERELGMLLFNRKGKSVQLNTNGEIVYQHAIRLVDLMNDAQNEIFDENDKLNYEISVFTLTIPKVMPHIIKSFKQKYPEIKLKVAQYQKKKDIADMRCDVMLYSSNDMAATEYSKTIYEEPIVLIVSKDHPFAKEKCIAAERLKEEQFIYPSEISDFGQLTFKIMERLGINPQIAVVSDYPSFVMELVASNIGISFQPGLTYKYYNNPDIVPVEVENIKPVRYITIGWNNMRYYSKAVNIFIDYTIEYMKTLEHSQLFERCIGEEK